VTRPAPSERRVLPRPLPRREGDDPVRPDSELAVEMEDGVEDDEVESGAEAERVDRSVAEELAVELATAPEAMPAAVA